MTWERNGFSRMGTVHKAEERTISLGRVTGEERILDYSSGDITMATIFRTHGSRRKNGVRDLRSRPTPNEERIVTTLRGRYLQLANNTRSKTGTKSRQGMKDSVTVAKSNPRVETIIHGRSRRFQKQVIKGKHSKLRAMYITRVQKLKLRAMYITRVQKLNTMEGCIINIAMQRARKAARANTTTTVGRRREECA